MSDNPPSRYTLDNLVIDTGVIFNCNLSCTHSTPFSNGSFCNCSYCNFTYRLFNYYKKENTKISRANFVKLTSVSFNKAFELVNRLFYSKLSTVESVRHAASTPSDKLVREYACPVLINAGTPFEAPSDPYCRNICNNVEHIFECASTSDKARRRYFPVCRKSNYWHTSCKNCPAACAYASPREGIILFLFFNMLKVKYTGVEFKVSLKCSDEWVTCSKVFAHVVLLMHGANVHTTGIDMPCVDPQQISMSCNVALLDEEEFPVEYGVERISRYQKDENVLHREDCPHEFVLTNKSGVSLNLSDEMFRMLMYLMPCHGYMWGFVASNQSLVPHDTMCGLYSAGGFLGLNVRCNMQFVELHKRFYEGGFRNVVMNQPYDEMLEPSDFTFHNAPAGLLDDVVIPHANTYYVDSSDEEEEEEELTPQRVDDIIALINQLQNDEPSMFEEEQVGTTNARSLGDLKKRVGGLIKGCTNCIQKLHAVWDWPLDTTLKAANKVGNWMESNKESVSDDVWSCQQCPEIQKDITKAIAEQAKVNDLSRETIRKLAATIDHISRVNSENFSKLEKEIADLKRNSESKLSMVPMSSNYVPASDPQPFMDYGADKKKKKPIPSTRPTEEIGEQMAIPKKVNQKYFDPYGDIGDLPFELQDKIKRAERADKHSNCEMLRVEDDNVVAHCNLKKIIKKCASKVKNVKKILRGKPRVNACYSIETISEEEEYFSDEVRAHAGDNVDDVGNIPIDATSGPPGTTEQKGGDIQEKKLSGTPVESIGSTEEHNAMLSKFYLGGTKWSVSDGSGKELKSYAMPGAIWQSNERLANILSYFQYYTVDGLVFEVTTTSVGMQGGTLLICWDAASCATKQKIDSALQLSNLPYETLSASSSKIVVLDIPSSSIQSQICTSGSEGSISALGCLKIIVANVLNAPAETNQSIQVNVWVRFKNPKMSFYTVKHEIIEAQSANTLSNLDQIESFEAIVAQGKWSTTSDTNLMELTVHPTAVHVSKGLVYQTSLSVISHLFNRWSGELKYKFVFGASMFVRGKLAISAVPVAFRNKKMTVAEITSFPCTICDLSLETREYVLSVPYISVGKNSLVTKDSLYDVSSYNSEFVVSRLHVVILDPLVMNANASNSIEFFVTVSPGKDFTLMDMTGVKAESIDRMLKHSFGTSLSCGKLMGGGFSEWVQIPSLLRKFQLNSTKYNALHMKVSPVYRTLPPCATLISWLAQLFVQWRGSLVYTLRAYNYDKQKASLVKIWYDSNGTVKNGEESEFLTEIDPPAGIKVHTWQPFLQSEITFKIPYHARTEKLLLVKARYEPKEFDWLHFYNGSFIIDYEGDSSMEFEMMIQGGEDFEMFEQTVAPKCGEVTSAFTKLTYSKKLHDITEFPKEKGVLKGPISNAEVTPAPFPPVPEIKEGSKIVPDKPGNAAKAARTMGPKEGDRAVNDDGDPLIFRNGAWDFDDDVESQMNCLPCTTFRDVNESLEILKNRETIAKVANLVDLGHNKLVEPNGDVERIAKAAKDIIPILDGVKRMTGKFEEKLDYFSGLKDKIMGIVRSLFTESIPGMIKAGLENEQYMWATFLTFVGACGILYATQKPRKFKKRMAILMMVVWSPFLAHHVWKVGHYVKKKAASLFNWNFETMMHDDETCRKHSLAGATEIPGHIFGNITEWMAGNWEKMTQGLLSLLGIVASLIIWGKIPDEKKITGWGAKFKSIGDKGRSITNIFSGWSTINKVCSEYSKKLVNFILSLSDHSLPKNDHALQMLLEFDLKQWVKETREMALQENRFKGFGADDHLTKVRRLYDWSVKVDEALLDGCKVDFTLGSIIRECKKKCEELHNESYTFKGMKQARIDPIHICMIGAPGVGKSTITHVIINNLLDYRGEPEVDRIYTRCCADAYWSNYHQEPVILYDDLGAIKSNLKLSDYAEIMGVKTNDPFSVPMAGVEEKGRHCTSKYVFSCTNVLALDDSGDVVTKAAYYRRRNVLVEVEKDPEIPRSETNPTQGLLFTVKHQTGQNGDRAEFGLKEEWTEPFLSEVNTTGWVFDRVDYETFFRFLCVYTDAYMSSQEKLLKGIKSFKLPKMEDLRGDDVIAHAGEEVTTLGNLIKEFDKHGFTGNQLCSHYKGTKYQKPQKWKRDDKVTFHELLKNMCGCSSGEQCCAEVALKHIGNILQDKLLMNTHRSFLLGKLCATDINRTQIKLKKPIKDIFIDHDPLAVFFSLATFIKWGTASDVCYYHSLASEDELTFKGVGAVPRPQEVVSVGSHKVVVWKDVGKFFPSVVINGAVAVFNGGEWVYVVRSASAEIKHDQARLKWLKMWNAGPEVKCKFHKLFSKDQQRCISSLFYGVQELGDCVAPNATLKEIINNAQTVFTECDMVIFHMLLMYKNQEFREKNSGLQKERQKISAFHAKEKLDKYESEMAAGLSKGTKIALAIGGGLVGAGVLIGLIMGCKSLFESLANIGGNDEETEEVELEAEMSSVTASDGMVTPPVKNQRRTPKVVVTNIEAQFSGAHQSDGQVTLPVRNQRRSAKVMAVAQGGVGTGYSDATVGLTKAMLLERRRKAKRDFVNLIKHSAGGCSDSCQGCAMDQELMWVDKLRKQQVIIPTERKIKVVGALRTISAQKEQASAGEFLIGNPEFKNDKDISDHLETLVSNNKVVLDKLIKNGTTVSCVKQAAIGSVGLDRDQNMTTLLHTHVSKMSCMLIKVKDDVMTCASLLRLTGTFVVMPAHYLDEFLEADKMFFVSPHKVVPVKFDTSRMSLVSKIQDLIVWDVGSDVGPSPNYIEHIPKEADWKNFKKSSGVLALTRYTSDMIMMINHTLSNIELCTVDVDVPTGTYEMLGSKHTVMSGLRYRVHCMPGFCGAAIVKADTSATRKIIGMHVAGQKTKGVGYAETLTYEPLMAAIERLRPRIKATNVVSHDSDILPDYVEKHNRVVEGKGNLGIIGVVPKSLLPNIPTKTTIAQSMIHGLIGEVKTEPSILSTWDRRLGDKRSILDPVLDADLKYGTYVKPFASGEVLEVQEHLVRRFAGFDNSLKKREVNTLEVGINGIDLSDFWGPMEMKTSAGYPYSLRKPQNAQGKEWLFKEVGSYPSGRKKWDIDDEEFKKSFNEMHTDILNGVKPRILTMACPKDERRKLSKIYDKPATRTFTILPPEINILFRMYFGDFAAMIMSTRFDHFCQVGINAESLEWSELMNSMLTVGTKGFAGDYAKFDGIGPSQIYMSIADVASAWYKDGDVNARARRALVTAIVHRDGLVGDYLVRYSQGMPSGFAMTVIFNSFVNYYFMALAWMNIIPKTPVAPQSSLEDFDYFTKLITYGDDNVVAVDENLLPYYNLQTVASFLSDYGITYTDDAKNPIHLSEPYVDITSVTFLKREFVKVGGSSLLWKAPLAKVSIEERCNWIRECEIPEEALYQNIESALYEAHIHGQEYFEELKGRINDALDRVCLEPVHEDYVACSKRWWNNLTGSALSQSDLTKIVNKASKGSVDLNAPYKNVTNGRNLTLKTVMEKAKFVRVTPFKV